MARTPKAQRCIYEEGGRVCPFPGTGTPRLCQPHRVALLDAARVPDPAELLAHWVRGFVSGRPVSPQETIDLLSQWFKDRGQGPRVHRVPHRVRDPVDPRRAEGPRRAQRAASDLDAIAHAMARQVLGFTANEPLTREQIQDRRRRLARQHHPDLAHTAAARVAATRDMASINAAADTLLAAVR